MKSKKLRQLVFEMYNGKCAYTGQPLDDKWQIDHIIPKCYPVWYQPKETRDFLGIKYDCNDAENLLPCCSIVNHYKRALDLEGFRRYMANFHIRLSKMPKKTRIPRTEKRKAYMNEVARLFGIEPDKPFKGQFYFESSNPSLIWSDQAYVERNDPT